MTDKKRCIVCGNMMEFCRCSTDREPRIKMPTKPGGHYTRDLPIDWPMSEPYAPGYEFVRREGHLAEVAEPRELVPA